MNRVVPVVAPFRFGFAARVRPLVVLVLALGLIPRVSASAPTVRELVDQFSPTNYLNLVSNTLYARQGMNRAPLQVGGGQHDLCRDAIHDEFQRVGLSPYKDPWSYLDTTNLTLVNVCNIIAVKAGVQNPNNEVYVIGSHYDSRENPGADDNATGVACQLEMARIFARHHFAKTIVFAIFDSEERWEAVTGRHRLGSLRYVAQHTNDNIKGMISVDMIGWQAPAPNHNKAALCGRTSFNAIRQDLQYALANYGDGLAGVLSSSDNMSDHYSFAQAGIPACCLIEYAYSSNPNYHRPTDYVEYPGYLDWTYLEKMCKSVVGYYATQLQPVDVTPRIVSILAATNNGVRVQAVGLPRCQYAVELNTDLASHAWVALETNTASATDGTFHAFDPQAGDRPGAYYRARFVSGFVGNPGAAPVIVTQPLSRTVDTDHTTSFTISANGTAPLSFQWRHNGTPISGATTYAYVISAAQLADAGSYSVVVNNDSGSATSQVVSLTVHPPQSPVFFDAFDTNSAASWTANRSAPDTRITFNYDYAADGIPSAPHSSGGTTRGVKFEANLANGATAAVSLSPAGQSFSGDYRLRFDMWINANGPFPLGGRGSSQFITGGLGTAGNRVQWTGAGSNADGFWFAVDGEGQATDTGTTSDFGAFSGTATLTAGSGVYAAGTDANARGNGNAYHTTAFPGGRTAPPLQQSTYAQQTGALAAGTVGFAWRDVIIARRGNTVEWSIDGVKLATVTNATFAANNVFVGYWDPFTSVSDNVALSFGLVDNVRVEVPVAAP